MAKTNGYLYRTNHAPTLRQLTPLPCVTNSVVNRKPKVVFFGRFFPVFHRPKTENLFFRFICKKMAETDLGPLRFFLGFLDFFGVWVLHIHYRNRPIFR